MSTARARNAAIPRPAAVSSTIGPTCGGGTAYGLGPQGDVQRAANYIRLVCDADMPNYSIYLSLITAD